jgi:hypothetical protein
MLNILLFINGIYHIYIIYYKKSFHPAENYGYISRTKSLAGAAEVQGRADKSADKEVQARTDVTRIGVAAMARDGREALPYPTPPMYPNP